MSITWTNVTDIAPELASVGVAQQTAILAQVNEELNADAWGTRLDRGRAWLAAHLGTLIRRKGVAGNVASESVGSVSRSYVVSVAAGMAQLGSTGYGAEFERQLLSLPAVRFGISD